MRAARVLVSLVALAGCVGHARHAAATAPRGDEITLYRDYALVAQEVGIDAPAATSMHVKVQVPAGLDASQIVVLERGALVVSGLSAAANEVTLQVTAPRAGHFALRLAYITDALHWDAGYTLTTTAARDRVSLRGAVAIRNETGIAFHDAQVYAVDAALASWRGRLAAQLGSALRGGRDATPTEPADLGRISLGAAELRVPLLAGEPPRTMHSVLVYDPIGTRLDHKGEAPLRDAATGITPPPTGRISESFEVTRPHDAPRGLPAGPVRLLERRPDGSLGLLGEGRLFDEATRVGEVDTIAIGTADGVTGRRERRDLTVDTDGKRVVEEFVLTVDNKRARPVEVVLREHLYRGETWALAYYSVRRAEKEGPQQISLRTTVPANSAARVLYVVVYSWADPTP